MCFTLDQLVSFPHHLAALPPFSGEAFYYFLQMVWAIYKQLAAMKVLPQITVGKATARGCPLRSLQPL